MKKIGIDFGTTNSTIAYLKERTGEITAYQIDGVGDVYIPSAIAYPKQKDKPTLIGKEAQQAHRNMPERYYYYEYYKLDLLKDCRQVLNEEHAKPVIEIVTDYLHELIVQYKQESRVKELDYITLSLPNVIMISDDGKKNAEAIKGELKALLDRESGGGNAFYGEAQCACEFYISKEENKLFTGDIVVVDYGGGTLDISNCAVRRDPQGKARIEFVTQRGTSVEESKFGNAGVAFDRGVVRKLDGLTGLSEADEIEYALEFENFKLLNHKSISNALKNFYEANRDDPLLCPLKGTSYSLKPSFLVDAFEERNLPLLKARFNEIVPEKYRKGGGAASQGAFRVLLVGGFSRLYCAERAIKDFLGIGFADDTDQRIADVNVQEKFLAVAYGAAILGERGEDSGPKTCLYEIGVKTFDGQDYENYILVKENTDSKTLREVTWSDDSFLILDAAQANVKLYCRTSTSGESERCFDISSACVNNCRVRLGVTSAGNVYSLRILNENTKAQARFDITRLLADYRDRN